MQRPSGALVVIPFPSRKFVLSGALLGGLAALLLCLGSTSVAHYAPVPTGTPLELRLVPADTYFVAHVRMAELLSRPIVKDVLQFLHSLDGRDARGDDPFMLGSKLS